MQAFRSFVLAVCCISAAAPAFALPDSTFQLRDLRRLVDISSPRIAPDGRRILALVSRWNWDQDKAVQQLILVNSTTGDWRSLTWHRTDLSEPRWSPHGGRIAFIADAPPSGTTGDAKKQKPQVFVMRMNGGDPTQITNAANGVDEFAWSPHGKRIAFVTEDSAPATKGTEQNANGFRVTENNYTVRKAVQPWHLWVVPSDGGETKRLTQGQWSLDTDQDTITPLAWSANGKHILFTRFPDVWYGDAYRSTIASVPADGGPVHTVIAATGSSTPVYAPGGNALAFMRARGGDLNNGTAVYVRVNGKVRDATADLARNISGFAWVPKAKTLLLSGDQGTRSVLWMQPLDGAAHRLNIGAANVDSDFTVAKDGSIAFVGSTAAHPDELYILDSPGSEPRRLTDLNGFLDHMHFGKMTSIQWKGPGGFDEDGVLTYPVGYASGHRYPLVLVIHGGPEGASLVDFNPLVQLFAAKGFLVFQPNYRGSINLGDAYQHAIYRDTGRGPGEDVMAGLSKVEQLGIVNTKRIGVSGWSYGGYMTSWLNGSYPSVWKAAVEGAALNDWVMDYTIAFYQKGDLYFFGDSPWTKKGWKIWRQQSPIRLARNVKAPTLIMGDVGDPNVPIVNSYEMYHALRDNGVTVAFYAYNANTHFPQDIVRQTSVFRRWIGWMQKYLK